MEASGQITHAPTAFHQDESLRSKLLYSSVHRSRPEDSTASIFKGCSTLLRYIDISLLNYTASHHIRLTRNIWPLTQMKIFSEVSSKE